MMIKDIHVLSMRGWYCTRLSCTLMDQLGEAARRTSWKGQLDGPAKWTSWTDHLDRSARRTIRILSQLLSPTQALFNIIFPKPYFFHHGNKIQL